MISWISSANLRVMYLLIPGRHHALTWFQFQYLHRFAHSGLGKTLDTDGNPLPDLPLQGAVFAVTSANHSGTRRNPLPFFLRAMTIQDFSGELEIPIWTVGVPDVGVRPDFADYVIKTIHHDLGLALTPENTVAAGSSPVMSLYKKLGFKIWGAEAETPATPIPWDLVERAASIEEWSSDSRILMEMHPACFKLWKHYKIGERVRKLFKDPMISADGDLTPGRDYGTYVRQMDEIALLKWEETAPMVRQGVIGDIGCAVGSWLKHASADPHLAESDFYGIEIARPLYEICHQRKENGEFANPNVWFAQRNAVTGLVFDNGTMTTIHTGSLTHEIESYGGRADLEVFLTNRKQELATGGVWINRDVIGPENGEEPILMELHEGAGQQNPFATLPEQNAEAEALLKTLSPLGLWRQFLQDWRPGHPRPTAEELVRQGRMVIKTTRATVSEFLLHKDYRDNWKSEMHETFCFWSFSEWKTRLESVGFRISPLSKVYTNPWILINRWENQVQLWKEAGIWEPEPWPPTTMIMVAEN